MLQNLSPVWKDLLYLWKDLLYLWKERRNLWKEQRNLWKDLLYLWKERRNLWKERRNLWKEQRNLWKERRNLWKEQQNLWKERRNRRTFRSKWRDDRRVVPSLRRAAASAKSARESQTRAAPPLKWDDAEVIPPGFEARRPWLKNGSGEDADPPSRHSRATSIILLYILHILSSCQKNPLSFSPPFHPAGLFIPVLNRFVTFFIFLLCAMQRRPYHQPR